MEDLPNIDKRVWLKPNQPYVDLPFKIYMLIIHSPALYTNTKNYYNKLKSFDQLIGLRYTFPNNIVMYSGIPTRILTAPRPLFGYHVIVQSQTDRNY